MIIKSLSIRNFRPYRKLDIEFASGDKNITIVQGRNDAGKTSFLNAITWCLYDKEPFRDEGLEDRCNKLAVSKLDVGKDIVVKVEILMEDNSGRDVCITREQLFTKLSEDVCEKKSRSSLTITRDDGAGDSRIHNPEEYINVNLPKSLQEYFMFTGEKLTQFFNKDQNFVKKGVHSLYQLDLLENISIQSKRWENYYSRKFANINPILENLLSQRSELIDNCKREKKQLKDNQDEIISANAEIEKLKMLIGAEGADAEEIMDDIDQLEDEKKTKQYELKDKQKEYSKILTSNFSIVMSYNLLKDLDYWKDFEENSESDKITSFAISDLKKLLKQDSCVCGNPLHKGSDSYKNIESLISLLENNQPNSSQNIEDLIDDLIKSSNRILANRFSKSIKMDIQSTKTKIMQLSQEIAVIDTKINGLKLRLEALDIDTINDINERIESYNQLITTLTEDNGVLKDNIKEYPSIIKELNEDIEEARGVEDEKNEFAQKRDFCESIKSISGDLYDILSEEIYTTLSDLVTEEYKNIHWKPEYKRIIVDNDFQVFVEKSGGNIVAATDPSTGSRNVLALTFMAALNSLSKFVLPQIIDTPIASLDDEMRVNLAKSLPRYMAGKQMILLVMDTEYTGEFKKEIYPYVGEEIHLKYVGNDDLGETIKEDS